jgi:hypothetical protein
MNRIIYFSIILFFCGNTTFAQDYCTGYDELFRKRHQIAGGQYGHPYTMFDRKNDVSFIATIERIRNRIG